MLESRRKRYLSGSDWVIATLDHLLKATTGSGNICQLALLLNAPLDGERFRERLNRFMKPFPVVAGRISRDLKLAPYWKIPPTLDRDIRLTESRLADSSFSDELLPELVRMAGLPFRDEREHLAFHLFSGERRGALLMRFDHRLFDARGAESFLHQLQLHQDVPLLTEPVMFSSSSALTHWNDKFRAGRNVNRRIIELSRLTPRVAPGKPSGPGCVCRPLRFDQKETAAILKKAGRMAGYLMESPFILAAITCSLHELFSSPPEPDECYLAPVTLDLRPGREPLEELFFNHVTYLFFQVSARLGGDMGELVTSFKQQLYDQVKSGFPRDLAEASLLSRIAPLPLMGRLLHLPLKGRLASFVFSHLGKSSFLSSEFMGCGVDGILHLPRIPSPPGLGFFSYLYNDRLTLTITCREGLLGRDELDRLELGLRRNLGASSS